MRVWRDGYFCRQDLAAAMACGKGVFETMLVRRGCAFFLGDHIRRLRRACPVVGIAPPSAAYLKSAVAVAIAQNQLREGRLRLSVSKTAAGASIVVSSSPMRPLPSSYSLAVEFKRHPPSALLSGVKTLERGFYDRAYHQVHRRGFNEILFLKPSGEVIEGSRTNIFCVRSGQVLTPRLESGCLPGITRARVIRLLKRTGVRCRLVNLTLEDLMRADEIFLTNAVIGLMPVCRVGLKRWPSGRATRRLQKLYRAEVEKACRIR